MSTAGNFGHRWGRNGVAAGPATRTAIAY